MQTLITEAIRDGNLYDTAELVQSRLDSGDKPLDMLKATKDGLDQCGKKFETGEYFLPEWIVGLSSHALGVGVDAAILDPFDLGLYNMLVATELVLGRDRFSGHYTRAFPAGKLRVEGKT